MPELNEYILQILKAQQEQQMAFQEHQQEQLIAQKEHLNALLDVIEKLASRQLETNKRVQQLAEDCQRYVRLKKDSKNIESGVSRTRKVRYNSSALKNKVCKVRLGKEKSL